MLVLKETDLPHHTIAKILNSFSFWLILFKGKKFSMDYRILEFFAIWKAIFLLCVWV